MTQLDPARDPWGRAGEFDPLGANRVEPVGRCDPAAEGPTSDG